MPYLLLKQGKNILLTLTNITNKKTKAKYEGRN